MALHLAKGIRLVTQTKTNTMAAASALSPLLHTKRHLSSDKPSVESSELQVFEEGLNKLDQHMQVYVLDRKTHTGQVGSDVVPLDLSHYKICEFVSDVHQK